MAVASFMGGLDRATILSKLPKSAIAHCEELAAKEVSEQIGIFYQRSLCLKTRDYIWFALPTLLFGKAPLQRDCVNILSQFLNICDRLSKLLMVGGLNPTARSGSIPKPLLAILRL